MDTKQKHKQLMTLLGKLNFSDEKRHDLVYCWTNGRSTSSRDLTSVELNDLLWKIQHDFNFQTSIDPLIQLQLRKQRAVILRIATTVGIHDPENWTRFNAFMKKSSVLKKPLKDYDLQELGRLEKQFRQIEHNFNTSAENAGTKAYNKKHGFNEYSEN